MRDLTGDQLPQKHISHSLVQHCMPIFNASPCIHTSLFIVHNYTWQWNSCMLWLCYSPNDGFTAEDALFYKNKVVLHAPLADAVHSIYLHVAVSFPITVDAINVWKLILKLKEVLLYLLISLTSTHMLVHCNKFAAKQQKKNTKNGWNFSVAMHQM